MTLPKGSPCKRFGNRVRMEHGLRSILTTGNLPLRCSYVRRIVNAFRNELEHAVFARNGELSLWHAATVQSACRHEQRAQLCMRWIRLKAESMSDADRLAYLREYGAATDARDRCLRQLGLDKSDVSIIDALYGSPITPAATSSDGAGQQDQQADQRPDVP